MSNAFTKLGIAAILGVFTAYLGIVAIPMVLLLILMVIDYCTGIGAAWVTGTLSSRKSISGILKKVGYLAVIAVGIICDFLIEYAFASIGQGVLASYAVGLMIIIWLILNECISILENLSEMGVPIPKFFKGIVKRLRIVTGKQLESTDQILPETDATIDETDDENEKKDLED